MSQDVAQLRHARRRARQRAKKRKEPKLSMKNSLGCIDLTPFNAVFIIRGEPQKMKLRPGDWFISLNKGVR